MLPTTATAHSTPARANFFVFIEIAPLIHQNLQGENGAKTAFPPCHARSSRRTPPAVENRSRLPGLLSRRNTASHRCFSGPDPGRSPSARSRWSRGAGVRVLRCTSFPSQSKNSGHPWVPAVRYVWTSLPTVALPTSGEGSKRTLPLSRYRLPCFVGSIMTPPAGICQAAC